MTELDTERGRLAYAEVMTVAAPPQSTPVDDHLMDVIFGDVWQRPGLTRRERRFITLPCVADADAEDPLRAHV